MRGTWVAQDSSNVICLLNGLIVHCRDRRYCHDDALLSAAEHSQVLLSPSTELQLLESWFCFLRDYGGKHVQAGGTTPLNVVGRRMGRGRLGEGVGEVVWRWMAPFVFA